MQSIFADSALFRCNFSNIMLCTDMSNLFRILIVLLCESGLGCPCVYIFCYIIRNDLILTLFDLFLQILPVVKFLHKCPFPALLQTNQPHICFLLQSKGILWRKLLGHWKKSNSIRIRDILMHI